MPTADHERLPGVYVEDTDGALILTRRWYTFGAIPDAVSAVVWSALPTLACMVTWERGEPDAVAKALLMLPFMAAGAYFIHKATAQLINSSTITLDDTNLSVRHHPLPWRGPQSIAASDIAQLSYEKKVRHGRGTSVTYTITVALHGGGQVILVSDIVYEEQAIFIVRELNRALRSRSPTP